MERIAMRIAAIAAVTLALAGCSGMKYAMDNYSGVPVVNYHDDVSGNDFRVFDKPAENRMMITLSIGGALLQGTMGSAGTTPEPIYENAAIGWLRSKGRYCTATKTFLVVEPQYEVDYDCSAKEDATQPSPGTAGL